MPCNLKSFSGLQPFQARIFEFSNGIRFGEDMAAKEKTKPSEANATSCLLSDRCMKNAESEANAIKICAIRWLGEKMGKIPENDRWNWRILASLKDCDRLLSVV